MKNQEIDGIFAAAHLALRDLEASMEVAEDKEIKEGRFTIKRGGISAELQWPYEGWRSEFKKSISMPLRLYVEGVILPLSDEPELIPARGEPGYDDGAF